MNWVFKILMAQSFRPWPMPALPSAASHCVKIDSRILTVSVATLLFFIMTARLGASTLEVTSLSASSSYALRSFEAGGKTYVPQDLIAPTLTGYVGRAGLIVPSGSPVPIGRTRAGMMTHDFHLNTGLSNVHEVQLTFASGLTNGPGPDLVFFNENFSTGVNFQVTANGSTASYGESRYDDLLLQIRYHQYNRNAFDVVDLSVLVADSYDLNTSTSGPALSHVFAIAIDLDDLAVPPLATVNVVSFKRPTAVDDALDPLLIMGIRSATVPEPMSILLVGPALAVLIMLRRGKQNANV